MEACPLRRETGLGSIRMALEAPQRASTRSPVIERCRSEVRRSTQLPEAIRVDAPCGFRRWCRACHRQPRAACLWADSVNIAASQLVTCSQYEVEETTMKKLTGSAVLLAALFVTGAQADDGGPSLQEQRQQIGNDMVRDRTGTPPTSADSINQPATNQNQQQQPNQVPDQQAPRSTLNSPARQNRSAEPTGNTSSERQPSSQAPGVPASDGQNSPPIQGGSINTPATPSAQGATGSSGGAATGGASN